MVKILLVDDDAQLAELYQIVLKEAGYEVVWAASAVEGIKQARQQPYQLILLDIMMPVMNGIEALKILKEDPPTANIPVVILSNVADEEYIKTALSSGAVEYMVKTDYSPQQFLDLIKKYI